MIERGVIRVEIDPEGTDDPIATIQVHTPLGAITAMAEVRKRGRLLELTRAHVHSDTGANTYGAARLRSYADVLMETFDVDEILVIGAGRTTGAGPRDRTRALRFTRKASA